MNETPDRGPRDPEDDHSQNTEQRDDPTEKERDESLKECLIEIAKLANEITALKSEPKKPREFWICYSYAEQKDPTVYGASMPEDCIDHYHEYIKVREVL